MLPILIFHINDFGFYTQNLSAVDPHEGYLVNDTLTNSTIRLLLTESDWNTMYEMYKGRCFKADARDAKYHFWNFWSSMDFASTILTTIGIRVGRSEFLGLNLLSTCSLSAIKYKH